MALATIRIDDLSLDSYRKFLAVKKLPQYTIKGREVTTDEDNLKFLEGYEKKERIIDTDLRVSSHLFDYQKFIVFAAIKKKQFAIFADCGLGKTAMFLEYARVVRQFIDNKKVLIVCPLMVIDQIMDEQIKFYGTSDIVNIHDVGMESWLKSDSKYGIVNIDKFKIPIELEAEVGCVILDESSCLKNETGVLRTNLINSTKGIEFKLACTATPAPNDREEYANHALFLEKIRSQGEFFAKYFVNKDNQWQLKKHATEAFYRYLASFSVFVRSPHKYGFDDNLKELQPPIIEEINIELTDAQLQTIQAYQSEKEISVSSTSPSSMNQRTKFAQIAKGFVLDDNKNVVHVESLKPSKIVELVKKSQDGQTLIWSQYDEEGEILSKLLQQEGFSVVNVSGKVPQKKRIGMIQQFKEGNVQVMITKPKLLGFGLNLQNVKTMIFSGINDSYEQFYQAIKRAHRYGSKHQLQVYIPITILERPMLENVLAKKEMFEHDATIQEGLYINSLANDLKDFIDKPVDFYVMNHHLRGEIPQSTISAWFNN